MKKVFSVLFLLCTARLLAGLPAWDFSETGNGRSWTLPAKGEVRQLPEGLYLRGAVSTALTIEFPEPIDAEQAKVVEYRIQASENSSAYLYFAREGEEFSADRRIRLRMKGITQSPTLTALCGSNKHWKGKIKKLKFTPIGRELDCSIVYSLRFLHQHGGLITNGSFEDNAMKADAALPDGWTTDSPECVFLSSTAVHGRQALGMKPGCSIFQNFELPQELPFHLSFQCRLEQPLDLSIAYFDIFDQPMRQEEQRISPAGSGAWQTVSLDCTPPQSAAFVTLAFRNPAGENFLDGIQAEYIRPQNAKYRVWDAQWLWAQDAAASRGKTVFFRYTFQMEDISGIQEQLLQVVTRNLGGSVPCDAIRVFFNGVELTQAYPVHPWEYAFLYDLKPFLREGRNLLAISVCNVKDPGGLLAEITTTRNRDGCISISCQGTQPGNAGWKATGTPAEGWEKPGFSDAAWPLPLLRGQPSPGSFCRIPYRFLGKAGTIALENLQFPQEIDGTKTQEVSAEVTLHVQPGLEAVAQDAAIYIHFYDPRYHATVKMPPVKFTREQLSRGKFTLKFPVNGLFLRAGKQQLRIFADRLALTDPPCGFIFNPVGNFWETTVTVTTQRQAELPVAKILNPRENPLFSINGKIFPTHRYSTSNHTQFTTREHLEILENISFPEQHFLDFHFSDWSRKADGTCDFSALDSFVCSYLSRHPDTYLTIHWTLDTSGAKGPHRDWVLAHPSEWTMDSKGNTNVGTFLDVNNVCSMASKPWQDLLCDSTLKFIRHIQESPYADRVIGIMPSCGLSKEWLYWGCQARSFTDYSAPYQNGFREWLRKKYTSLPALCAAWHRQLSSWEDACVPTEQEQRQRKYRDHLLPEQDQPVMDLREYHSDLVASLIKRLCHTVKEGSGYRLLAGVYYGYITYFTGPFSAPFSGHYGLHHLLDCKDIDFLMSPNRYDDRGDGGASGFMSTIATLREHGILWVNEADNRLLHSWDPAGRVSTLRGSRAVLEREFASCFATGTSLAWFDFGEGWLACDSRLVQVYRNCLRAGKDLALGQKQLVDCENAIAVVTDERGIYRCAYDQSLFLNLVGIYPQLLRAGMGVHWYLLDDLDKLDRYRCIVFTPTCSEFSREQCRILREKLQKNNRTLVFLYGTGVYNDGKLQMEQAGRLSGIAVQAAITGPAKQLLRKAGKKDPLLEQLPSYYSFCFSEPTDFLLFPKGDQQTRTLFTVNDSGQPGMLRKNYPEWTAVFSSAPNLPAPFLRNLAKANQLLVYDEHPGDVIYAGKNLLGVHTIGGGPRVFHAPRGTVTATELLTGKKYPISNGCLQMVLPSISTVILQFQ